MSDYLPHELEGRKGLIIGAVVFVGIALILLMRKSSGASNTNPLISAQLQQNALSAQENVSNNQIGAQVAAAQQSANLQEQQAAIAANATNNQTYASLISNIVNARAADNYAATAAQVQESQIGAQENMFNNYYSDAANVNQSNDNLLAQEIAARSAENNAILNTVGKAGLNHGTASLEENLTGIIGEVLNEPGVAVAGEQASAYSNASNNSMWASIINSISNAAGNAMGSIFA